MPNQAQNPKSKRIHCVIPAQAGIQCFTKDNSIYGMTLDSRLRGNDTVDCCCVTPFSHLNLIWHLDFGF